MTAWGRLLVDANDRWLGTQPRSVDAQDLASGNDRLCRQQTLGTEARTTTAGRELPSVAGWYWPEADTHIVKTNVCSRASSCFGQILCFIAYREPAGRRRDRRPQLVRHLKVSSLS